MADDTQGILLESGTNEMELLEFYLQEQSFGVNVAKVRQLVPFSSVCVTRMPKQHKHVLGTVLWQDQSICLIDLNRVFGHQATEKKKDAVGHDNRIILVTEFNKSLYAFLVDGVNRIHRVHWDQMQPAGSFLGQFQVPVISTITLDHTDVLLVDLEHVVSKMNLNKMVCRGIDADRIIPDQLKGKSPDQVNLLLAEDSATIQAVVLQTLAEAGYTNVKAFDNGGSAYNCIKQWHQQVQNEDKEMGDFLDLLITDIEMPQMDGLTLCNRVKKELNLKVPVIVFSSLINQAMQRKCQAVQADASISKSDAVGLVEAVDQLLAA